MFPSLKIGAQQNDGVPFEGEIEYETFENYSDLLKETPGSIYFDGVHKIRLIVKGDKVHKIDETTKCHSIYDSVGYTDFCDFTKSGIIVKEYSTKFDGKISKNTFAKTETTETKNNVQCQLYEGDVELSMMMLKASSHIKFYASEYIVPTRFIDKTNFVSLNTPDRLPMNWEIKLDGGNLNVPSGTIKIPLGNKMPKGGEISSYFEGNVVKITPRTVLDSEFDIPKDYKMTNMRPMKAVSYNKSIMKKLKELGIKGGTESKDVHFKNEGEWDF